MWSHQHHLLRREPENKCKMSRHVVMLLRMLRFLGMPPSCEKDMHTFQWEHAHREKRIAWLGTLKLPSQLCRFCDGSSRTCPTLNPLTSYWAAFLGSIRSSIGHFSWQLDIWHCERERKKGLNPHKSWEWECRVLVMWYPHWYPLFLKKAVHGNGGRGSRRFSDPSP